MKVWTIGKVDAGKLHLTKKAQFLKELALFEGKSVIVTVETKFKKRSTEQNNYLHLLLQILTDELNEQGMEMTPDQVKDMMKYLFLKVEVFSTRTGEKIGERIRSTAELTTVQMCEFTESIIQWAAGYGIVLPYPNEQLELTEL